MCDFGNSLIMLKLLFVFTIVCVVDTRIYICVCRKYKHKKKLLKAVKVDLFGEKFIYIMLLDFYVKKKVNVTIMSIFG